MEGNIWPGVTTMQVGCYYCAQASGVKQSVQTALEELHSTAHLSEAVHPSSAQLLI